MTKLKLLCVAALVLCSANIAAADPDCSFTDRGAYIMKGAMGSLKDDDLAYCAAPALWFSPDEPLKPDHPFVPSPLPLSGQVLDQGRVVYYRIRSLTTGRIVRPRLAIIRYMFYYPEDIGFGRHWHDLESVEVTIEVARARDSDDEEEARITRVAGAAHGLGWYSNTLDIAKNDIVKLPVTILVEEGKHASAPDRNRDGFFNPGYDVNQYTRDAWGVRDTLVSKYQPGAAYGAEMSKPRFNTPIVWPPSKVGEQRDLYVLLKSTDAPVEPELKDQWPCGSKQEDRYKRRKLETSDLSPAWIGLLKNAPEHATDDGAIGELNHLLGNMDFCGAPKGSLAAFLAKIYGAEGIYLGVFQVAHANHMPQDFLMPLQALTLAGIAEIAIRQIVLPHDERSFLFPSRPFSSPLETPQVAVTWDGGNRFFVFGIPAPISRVPGIDGQLAVRTSFRELTFQPLTFDELNESPKKTLALDVLYTPSVARIADWYASVGLDHYASVLNTYDRVAVEGGVRLRFPTPSWIPIPFVGVRAGIRTSDLHSISSARPVVEIGFGAF